MNSDNHEVFQRMIDESLAGAISVEKERSLRGHLATCAACQKYLSVSNRAIASLTGFSFEVNPTLNATVLAVLRLRAEEGRGMPGRNNGTLRQHSVPIKNWTAFVVAVSMSLAGSGLVYQMAERLTVPMHFVSAHVQACVLVFWLMPSLCAALCLLAAPGEKRGIA